MLKLLLVGLYLSETVLLGGCDLSIAPKGMATTASSDQFIQLPAPRTESAVSLEQAIAKRRSVRDYAPRGLSWEEVGQLVWAGQGITDPRQGLRAAPSAGALYPLELYVVVKEGVYHYLPARHALELVKRGDQREVLCAAALSQRSVRHASLNIVIAAVYERTGAKYGSRAERYVMLEAGHVCQNILLQAVALGLGGVPIGAYFDDRVQAVLGCPSDHRVLYIIPVGVSK